MVAAEELQEQLLTREEELTWREEALTMREEKSKITKKALVKVSADLDAERAKTEATRQEYLDKMWAYTDHAKHTLSLDKILEEKKVQLDEKGQDLALREAETHARGLDPWDNQEELMELVGLRKRLEEAEVACTAVVGQLAVLVGDISKALVDLGMPAIPRIPQDLWEAYASSASP
jgi:hypothetical protein